MSCAKEVLNPEKETPQNKGVPMTFNVTVLETRAAKTDWADGDKIYVFFNGMETKCLMLERSNGNWTDTSVGGTLLDSDFFGLGTKTLTAVHFPVAVDVTFADGKFSFTSGGRPIYNYYLFETDKTYTVDGTTVTATLSMGKPADMVQIHVAGIESSVADYTFGCSKIRPVACKSVGTDGAITEDVLQAGARLSGISDSDGGIFAGRLTSPGTAVDYVFTMASDDKIYTLTRTGKTLTAGTMYNFPALSVTGGTNWAVTDASDLYVDLGLSVKLAKCNLGATNPEDYGDYFAWGELQPKSDYQWSTYLYGSDYDQLTKYCGNASRGKDGYTDDLTVLEQSDDAAYAAFGGQFRMPTQEEVYELLQEHHRPLSDEELPLPGCGRSGHSGQSFRTGLPVRESGRPAASFRRQHRPVRPPSVRTFRWEVPSSRAGAQILQLRSACGIVQCRSRFQQLSGRTHILETQRFPADYAPVYPARSA